MRITDEMLASHKKRTWGVGLALLWIGFGVCDATVASPARASYLRGVFPQDNGPAQDAAALEELHRGMELTRAARFAEAIPHLQRSGSGYAARFNLALCYLGTRQYAAAIAQLRELQVRGDDTAAVNTVLAQAYLGERHPQEAWTAMLASARLTPKDERMYAFLADACTDHYEYALGLRVADLGLRALPDSARLHYERAVFLARLDRLDEARPEFARAERLGRGTDIGYLAAVQASLYDDRFAEAATEARAAIKAGQRNAQTLTLLGDVLLKGGAVPGEAGFEEAREALGAAVAMQPEYSTARIALGTLYLREGRAADAVPQFEAGRRSEPENPAVYVSLAAAYRQTGNRAAAAECSQRLGELLKEKAAASSGPPR